MWSIMASVRSVSTTSPLSVGSRATPPMASSTAASGNRGPVVEIVRSMRPRTGWKMLSKTSSVPSASGLPLATRPVSTSGSEPYRARTRTKKSRRWCWSMLTTVTRTATAAGSADMASKTSRPWSL